MYAKANHFTLHVNGKYDAYTEPCDIHLHCDRSIHDTLQYKADSCSKKHMFISIFSNFIRNTFLSTCCIYTVNGLICTGGHISLGLLEQ